MMWELGLGRVRVLSADGRDEAGPDGDNRPNSPLPRQPQAMLNVRLSHHDGPTWTRFGLCANEFSPSDGKVVSL